MLSTQDTRDHDGVGLSAGALVRLTSLADVVGATGIAGTQRRALPKVEIVAVTDRALVRVFAAAPGIDHLLTDGGAPRLFSVWRDARRQLRPLRKDGGFDLAVDLQGTRASAAWVYASGAERTAYQKQYMFVRENPRLAIDVHWDFTGTSVPFPLAPDEIWSNLGKANIGGLVVPTLGRANFALLLAGHGAKEGWRCLTWVVDFARFIEKHRDLDWSDLLDRARRKGCGLSVLVGCRPAARLLGTRVDADILRLTENDVQARRTADALVARISNGYPVAALDRDFGDLVLCENWLQKARAIKKLIITRTVGDYVSMPLPRPLWRVYHFTRPFRLAIKVIANFGLGGRLGRRRTVLSGIPQV